MSTDPYGWIGFGVVLEEEENPLGDAEDLAEYMLRLEGVEDIYDEGEYPFKLPQEVDLYTSYEARLAWVKANQPEWWAKKEAWEARHKELEAEAAEVIYLRDFGYEDIHRFIIAIPGTVQVGPEWTSEPIKHEILEMIGAGIDPVKWLAAEEFCEKWNLPKFVDPKWVVGAKYG